MTSKEKKISSCYKTLLIYKVSKSWQIFITLWSIQTKWSFQLVENWRDSLSLVRYPLSLWHLRTRLIIKMSFLKYLMPIEECQQNILEFLMMESMKDLQICHLLKSFSGNFIMKIVVILIQKQFSLKPLMKVS
jgi:hypothetical protein